jgi:hypothetical protein
MRAEVAKMFVHFLLFSWGGRRKEDRRNIIKLINREVHKIIREHHRV